MSNERQTESTREGKQTGIADKNVEKGRSFSTLLKNISTQ